MQACQWAGTDGVILDDEQDVSFEQELTQDVVTMMTVFSARLYETADRSVFLPEAFRLFGDSVHEVVVSGLGVSIRAKNRDQKVVAWFLEP